MPVREQGRTKRFERERPASRRRLSCSDEVITEARHSIQALRDREKRAAGLVEEISAMGQRIAQDSSYGSASS